MACGSSCRWNESEFLEIFYLRRTDWSASSSLAMTPVSTAMSLPDYESYSSQIAPAPCRLLNPSRLPAFYQAKGVCPNARQKQSRWATSPLVSQLTSCQLCRQVNASKN